MRPGLKKYLTFGIFSSALVLAGTIGTTRADDDKIWPVKGRLISIDGGKSENMSGIACTGTKFPRSCLVIDDNMQAAQFVTVKDGEIRAGEPLRLIEDQFDGAPLELDGEGVTYADGSFYVIGSHGHPRDKKHHLDPIADAEQIKAKIAASSQIVRIRLKSTAGEPITADDIKDIERSSRLREFIAGDPSLQKFLDRRLENNGVTVEGAAVLGNKMFVGFRGPSLENGRAPVLSVSLNSLFGTGPAESKLYLLPLGEGRGVRDLAPFDDGLLVLAGPTGDEAGPYAVYWWSAANEKTHFLADITEETHASKKEKPEAILPLEQGSSGLRVLILSDGGEEGAPRAITVPAP